jgi:hypothetical protein
LLVGLTRKLRPLTALKALLAVSLVATTLAVQPAEPLAAEDEEQGCAFPFTPTTYEGLRNRELFLDTIELAAFDMLFPGDPYFGLAPIEVGLRDSERNTEPALIPPVILKSIAYVESSIAQGSGDTPYGSIGPALVAFDCGHGVTQVTTGMTVPTGELGRGSPEQALVATHFAYNIARGAAILVDKWNEAPEDNPIAGTDTSAHPAVIENWYFAIWSYNGFTGPGANKSNHPMDPIYGEWPREEYSCGPESDGLGHNRSNYPYQELIIGCATNPPVVDGERLWQPQQVSLPDLNDREVKDALDLDNFVYPYARMDIPTSQPYHLDDTSRPARSLRDTIIGEPEIAVSDPTLSIGYSEETGSTTEIVDIFNLGTGVLAWYAIPSAPWLSVLPYTGVAVGLDYECNPGVDCDRAGHLEITVDPSELPAGVTEGKIVLQGLGTTQQEVITVRVNRVMRLGAPGITRN